MAGEGKTIGADNTQEKSILMQGRHWKVRNANLLSFGST